VEASGQWRIVVQRYALAALHRRRSSSDLCLVVAEASTLSRLLTALKDKLNGAIASRSEAATRLSGLGSIATAPEGTDVMAYGAVGGGRPIGIAVKRKVFVSYHQSGDQPYYDAFAKHFCDTYEVLSDNSLACIIDSDDVDYVMRRTREDHIRGSSSTVVLVGRDAPLRRYVDWEIMATLETEHGLIAVQLPGAPLTPNNAVNVPARWSDNIKTQGTHSG
jgi:hypothetical protein